MLLLAPLLAVLAAADALGSWTANGARLELSDEEGVVVGRLADTAGPCALPKGTELLRGTLLDDSLSAQVRVCLLSEKCGTTDQTALAVLLVTQMLTGGVHSKAECAKDVRSLVLRRPGPPSPMAAPKDERLSPTPPPPLNSREPAPGPIAVEKPFPEQQREPGYDPRDAQPAVKVLLEQGADLLKQGYFEQARKKFLAAAQTDPKRAEAFNGVGVTFYSRADLDEATAWYKRALVADPRFGDAFYNLACAYALQGHSGLAFRYLRLAALNGYSARELMEADPDLVALRKDPQWAQVLGQAQ